MKTRLSAGAAKSTLRRTPQQARSRQIVGRILTAAHGLISEGGFSEFTTNHLAERAGMSIGSIYRYFPNKESILSALAEDMVGKIQQHVTLAVSNSSPLEPFEDLAYRVILGFVKLMRAERSILSAVGEHMEAISSLGMIVPPEVTISDAIVRIVQRERGALRHDGSPAAFALATSTVSHLSRQYVLHRHPAVDEETFSRLLSDLVVRFLHADPAGRPCSDFDTQGTGGST